MNRIALKGYVLRSQKVGRSDRLLTLLTAKQGILTAFANGAAKPQSPLVALSLPYTLSSFLLRVSKDSHTVQSGELIYTFSPLREDFDRLAEADRLSKLFADAIRHDTGQKSVYELYGHALYALCKAKNPAFVGALAACRLLGEIGYSPWLSDCVVCHSHLDSPYVFDLDESGLCCPHHAGGFVSGLSPAVVTILRHVENAMPDRLFAVQVDPQYAKDFVMFSDRYIELKMERQYERFLPPDPADFQKAFSGQAKKDSSDTVQ